MTYLENKSYDVRIRVLAARINQESIYSDNEEPVVTVDSLKLWLAELFGICPESSRPDDERARVLPFKPATIVGKGEINVHTV